MSDILEVDNVELYFDGKQILGGVYIKCEVGKITGLLGSNGSGKSSLLHIIFGSLKAKYKLIRLNNQPILKPVFQTKLVYLLPQKQILPSFISLATAFKLQQVSWEDFILEFPSFVIYKNHKCNSLSGGELKIVELYLALKSPAKFVLLDEPFMHLSPLMVDQFTSIINQEKQYKGIVITDHQYRHILNLADTLYLLKNGSTTQIKAHSELEDAGYLSYGTL